MKVLVIDGQGGGVGRAIVEQLKKALPEQKLMAVGTNVLATSAMIKAGADMGATGENAVVVNAKNAELILGPFGIVLANAMMGELTPRMAEAIGSASATKILIPVSRCGVLVAGMPETMLATQIEDAVRLTVRKINSNQ